MSMLLGSWRSLLDHVGLVPFVPSDIPLLEANTLVRLYNSTNGPIWVDHTDWLIDLVVDDWYGVTVVANHVTGLDLDGNGLNGDIGSWRMGDLPLLTTCYLYNNVAFLGNVSDWRLPVLMSVLYLYATNLSGTPDISANTAMDDYRYDDCALIQANVDAVLFSIYNRRMAFTSLTPALNIGGTNAAPSGIYQYAAVPSTGQEYHYALENDDDGEGFNTWTITV